MLNATWDMYTYWVEKQQKKIAKFYNMFLLISFASD